MQSYIDELIADLVSGNMTKQQASDRLYEYLITNMKQQRDKYAADIMLAFARHTDLDGEYGDLVPVLTILLRAFEKALETFTFIYERNRKEQ